MHATSSTSQHPPGPWMYHQPMWMAAMAQAYMNIPVNQAGPSKEEGKEVLQKILLNRIIHQQQMEALKLKRKNTFSIDSILGIDSEARCDSDRSEKEFEGNNNGSPSPTQYFPSSYQNENNCRKTQPGYNYNDNLALSRSKRVRTIFSAEQLERLEAEFERQQYMVGPERLYLAASLQLTESQVKVWFQNRRIKWRKQHIEQQKGLQKSDLRSSDLSDQHEASFHELSNR